MQRSMHRLQMGSRDTWCHTSQRPSCLGWARLGDVGSASDNLVALRILEVTEVALDYDRGFSSSRAEANTRY